MLLTGMTLLRLAGCGKAAQPTETAVQPTETSAAQTLTEAEQQILQERRAAVVQKMRDCVTFL